MANGLNTLGGLLGLVIVGGMAMKMTESMYNQPQRRSPRRRSRRTRRQYSTLGSTLMGPFNFSNYRLY